MLLNREILAQAGIDISSLVSIEVKAGRIGIGAADNAPRRLHFPCSEAHLLKELDAHAAHANELAQPSLTEIGNGEQTQSQF